MDKVHPGWKLSRGCVHDTLVGKRVGTLRNRADDKATKLFRVLYPLAVRSLRDTQLAPHIEDRMIPGRYWMRAKAGEFAGEPCSVCGAPIDPAIYYRMADDPFVKVLVDDDYYICEKCLQLLLGDLKIECPDMNVIYTNEDNGIIWIAGPERGAKGFMVADYYRFAEGDEEERRQFLYALLYAHQPGMKYLDRHYHWLGD